MYICVRVCNKINEKEAMDLEEIKMGYMGKSGGRKVKGKVM